MALKYLGHFMGDIHQPLHVSFQDDRGGNSVDTTGICGSNLHSAWDTCLLKMAVGSNPLAAAFALEAEITDADRTAWAAAARSTGPTNRSRSLLRRPLSYCVEAGGMCEYEAGNVEFDHDEPQKTVVIDAAYVAMEPCRSSASSSNGPGFASLMYWTKHWPIEAPSTLLWHARSRFRATVCRDSR